MSRHPVENNAGLLRSPPPPQRRRSSLTLSHDDLQSLLSRVPMPMPVVPRPSMSELLSSSQVATAAANRQRMSTYFAATRTSNNGEPRSLSEQRLLLQRARAVRRSVRDAPMPRTRRGVATARLVARASGGGGGTINNYPTATRLTERPTRSVRRSPRLQQQQQQSSQQQQERPQGRASSARRNNKKHARKDPPNTHNGPPHKKRKFLKESCRICMCVPDYKDASSLDSCDHQFCLDCIQQWSKQENSCPLCKKRFTSIQTLDQGRTIAVPSRDQHSSALEGLLEQLTGQLQHPFLAWPMEEGGGANFLPNYMNVVLRSTLNMRTAQRLSAARRVAGVRGVAADGSGTVENPIELDGDDDDDEVVEVGVL